MQKYKYIIVGGGIAGGRTAEGIRKVDGDGSIALVTAEHHRPYERPPLSKSYLRGEAGRQKVFLQKVEFYPENDIHVLNGLEAVKLEPDKRQLTLDNGEVLEYQKLMLATGGRAKILPLEGGDLDNVFTLRTLEDAKSIRTAAGDGKHALVMGGSFIGAEVAASLREMGTQVTEIFPEDRLLKLIVPGDVSQLLLNKFESKGVNVLPGTVAQRLYGNGTVSGAVLDNGDKLDIDLVVMGVGIDLNTELAVNAGLDIRETDRALLLNENLQSSDPNIYGAGDIAAWPDSTFDRRLRVEHWDVARRQGLRAGQNMAGDVQPYTALPYFFSDLFDFSFEVWGVLSSWDATILRGSLDTGSFGYFYFDDGKLTGVFATGRPDHERLPIQSLIKERAAYDTLTDVIPNEDVKLDDLVEGTEEIRPSVQAGKIISFEADIRPLFRKKDVEEMKDIAGFDLSDYNDARKWADGIYSTLVDGSMPCDGPWLDEDIAKFKQWMETGYKKIDFE